MHTICRPELLEKQIFELRSHYTFMIGVCVIMQENVRHEKHNTENVVQNVK